MSIRDERQALITAQRLCELLADASANKEKAKKAGKNRVYPSPFDDDPPPPQIAIVAERAEGHRQPELASEEA